MLEGARKFRTLDLLRDIITYDSGVFEHCVRVKNYSLLIGEELRLSEDDLTELQQAAVLHDYGKIFMPKPILFKNGRLTDEERQIIELHVTLGCDALREVKEVSSKALQAISEHHERINGKGYPLGVDTFSVLGQIIAISDVYDAVTHKRCYKTAYSKEYAIALIKEDKDAFDQNLIEAFCKAIQNNDDDDVISCYDGLFTDEFSFCECRVN